MKKVDLNKTIYEVTEEYPELVEILAELGFVGVRNPIMRNTVGRKTRIIDGAKLLKIDLDKIIEALKLKGFEVER